MDEYVVVFEGNDEDDRGLCDDMICSFQRAIALRGQLLHLFPKSEYNIYKLTRVEE
jgi:hypothetical protein